MACGCCSWKCLAVTVLLFAMAYPFIRQYVKGGVCESKARMDGKVVLVTGANTGIGKETVRDLVTRGARVLMACRNQTKCAAAAEDVYKSTGQRPEVRLLDLADLGSVRQFSAEFNKNEPKLDVLINNAGVMMCPKLLSKQGYEMQLATNHLGHFLLTELLLPVIKKSAPSRIVIVSSLAHARGSINFDDINSEKDYNRITAYGQSKLANILHSNELAKRLKGTGVTVNSLHPGSIDTDLARHILEIAPYPLSILMQPLYGIATLFIKTSVEGAQTTICCAVSEELEGVTGKYFSDCKEKQLGPHALDEDAARRLWEISEKMVGLKPKGNN